LTQPASERTASFIWKVLDREKKKKFSRKLKVHFWYITIHIVNGIKLVSEKE